MKLGKMLVILTSSAIVFSSIDQSKLMVTHSAAEQILNHATNSHGVSEAKSVSVKNGEIILQGECQGKDCVKK